MSLDERQKRHLRGLAHKLKPVVIVGNQGVSDALIAELDRALAHHELLKVRANAEDRDARDAVVEALCARTGSELVQRIGHIAVLYRRADEPRIQLP